MTDLYLARQPGLRSMIDRWIESGDVVGPKRTLWGDVLFEALDRGEDCELDFDLQAAPPKEWLLPQVETLFTYEVGARTRIHQALDATRRVLFGLRPCDMAGIAVLDRLMAGPLPDQYYAVRRQKTTCVVMACDRVFDGHFCHLLDTGPALESLFDWQITRLGDDLAIEVGTDAGRRLLESVRDLVAPAAEAHRSALLRSHAEARRSAGTFVDLDKVRHRLRDRDLQAAVWQGLVSRCQSCGGCSFICPSCGCFSIVDVQTGSGVGERQRRWDSCAFSGFTHMAGGANPGGDKARRIHRRFYHKLACAARPDEQPACVGCARCVNACVGNVHLPDVLAQVLAEGTAP